MARKKKVLSLIFVLLVLAAAGIRLSARDGDAAARPGLRPETPPYAARGAHAVGVRDLHVCCEPELDVTAWYPTGESGAAQAVSYRYGIKVVNPFGTVEIASYQGEAYRDGSYDPSACPCPLVILSPGFGMSTTTYGWLGEHLASHGFVVMAPEHREHFDASLNGFWQSTVHRPPDVQQLLAFVEGEAAPGGALDGVVDAEQVAVVGHSYGGFTALAAAGARLNPAGFERVCETARETDNPNAWLCDQLLPHVDEMAVLAGLDETPDGLWPAWDAEQIDAIVPLAGDAYLFGADGLAEIEVPVLAIGGTADTDTPYEWGSALTYEHVSASRKIEIALEGAEHMIFTGPCATTPWYLEPLSGEFCADAAWDRHHAHDLVRHFTTAFLLAELRQDAEAAAALAPGTVDFSGVEYEAEGYR